MICFDYNEIISIQHVHHWYGASAHRQLGLTPIAMCSSKVEGFNKENIFPPSYTFYADFEYIWCTSYKH